MSLIVRVGKAGKQILRKTILPAPPPRIRYTRRIERVKTSRRICAMTFDDGPMNMPAAPDRFGGRVLTDILLDTLAAFDARGTFDVIGDTSDNYPDEAGKAGSATWGGIHFDHYPDINRDAYGGAFHNDRLIRRMLDEGHQITNHGYRHILFGKKNIIYAKRVHYGMISRVEADLRRLHDLLQNRYDYTITMGRPPHYVDRIRRGFTSYDAYERMHYQYLGASFDGGGWLPSNLDGDAAIEAEVNAMTEPIRRTLEKNPDFFCGQIIFQKDGYNMARRTPIAIALPIQLELLRQYGYSVVTVDELMQESPFADVGREDPLFHKLSLLSQSRAVVFSDNTLRLEQTMTTGELAMLLAPRDEALNRRRIFMLHSGKFEDLYSGAMAWCVENGIFPKDTNPNVPLREIPYGAQELFENVQSLSRRNVYDAFLRSLADWNEDDEEPDAYDESEAYDRDLEENGAYVEGAEHLPVSVSLIEEADRQSQEAAESDRQSQQPEESDRQSQESDRQSQEAEEATEILIESAETSEESDSMPEESAQEADKPKEAVENTDEAGETDDADEATEILSEADELPDESEDNTEQFEDIPEESEDIPEQSGEQPEQSVQHAEQSNEQPEEYETEIIDPYETEPEEYTPEKSDQMPEESGNIS